MFGGAFVGAVHGQREEATQFQEELGRICAEAYRRPGAPTNPMKKLVRGQLTIEEARAFWWARWPGVLFNNQFLWPQLLRRCPDLDARVQLWPAISVEYGQSKLSESHPILYRQLLLGLGIPEQDCSFASTQALSAQFAPKLAKLEAQGWHELLGGFLARETVGPAVFGRIAQALERSFGISGQALSFFTVHAGQDEEDSRLVMELVARYGTTHETRELICKGVQNYFAEETSYCCELEA